MSDTYKEPKTRMERKGRAIKGDQKSKDVYNQKSIRIQESLREKSQQRKKLK